MTKNDARVANIGIRLCKILERECLLFQTHTQDLI